VRYLIIAFADQEIAGKLKNLLAGRGLPVRGSCATAAQVLHLAAECDDGGVVICPISLPDMTAREMMNLLPDSFDLLVLITPRQQGMIDGAGVFALTWPLNGPLLVDSARQILETRQLLAALTGRQERLYRPDGLPDGEYQPAASETAHGRTTEERKIVEQAKYLLMNRRQISEAEAHRYLQKRSMETGLRLVDVARRIISPK
jgi:two-component system, response regulator PdtaR